MHHYKKLLIIISRTERTQRTAGRIKNTAHSHNINCEIIFLEDIIVSNHKDKILQKNNTTIYFLTNHRRLGLYVEHFAQQGYMIINKQFLQGERSKLFIQNKITIHNISTPLNELLTSYKNGVKFINKIKLPVYIKSQDQMNTVLYIKDHTNLKRSITRLQNNIGEWYIEKACIQNKNRLIKIYYTHGEIFTDKKIRSPLKLEHDIANILHLNIFSADMIISPSGKYWIIDINPAPGFYAHTIARETFIKYIFQKDKEK